MAALATSLMDGWGLADLHPFVALPHLARAERDLRARTDRARNAHVVRRQDLQRANAAAAAAAAAVTAVDSENDGDATDGAAAVTAPRAPADGTMEAPSQADGRRAGPRALRNNDGGGERARELLTRVGVPALFDNFHCPTLGCPNLLSSRWPWRKVGAEARWKFLILKLVAQAQVFIHLGAPRKKVCAGCVSLLMWCHTFNLEQQLLSRSNLFCDNLFSLLSLSCYQHPSF